MSKAGPSLLRSQLVRSADTARTFDPQLAAVYYTQMVERGANHIKALSVVAAHLGERAWAVLARGTPYAVRDLEGRPISSAEARAIIAERYQVPEEVRRRRRGKRAGKALTESSWDTHDALDGAVRGDLPRRSWSGIHR